MKYTMCCRCCQSCFEDFYWNCIEEKFCYDETIANYNPDDDEYFQKQNGTINGVRQSDNNNTPICNQPIHRNPSILSASKIHEDDFHREIQTSVPILAPEILAVFANSQIFHEHQPPKLTKTLSKNYLPGIHGKDKEIDQEKLIKRLEGVDDVPISIVPSSTKTIATGFTTIEPDTDKRIKFTISPDSSPPLDQLRRSMSPNKFTAIIEEDTANNNNNSNVVVDKDELILRPPQNVPEIEIDNASSIEQSIGDSNQFLKAPNAMLDTKKGLRNVQSVPYFSFRPASENDIFAISGSASRISMTPEIPSISFTTLPKNYEDTPTIEKYKESTSLYSIQAANMAKVLETDYSMPRFFRKSGIMAGKSADNFVFVDHHPDGGGGGGDGGRNLSPKSKAPPAQIVVPQKRIEKSKRLKNLRDSLPPLRIHSIRQKFRDEPKNVD